MARSRKGVAALLAGDDVTVQVLSPDGAVLAAGRLPISPPPSRQ